ncbi:hypothetical protein [Halalkalicoccus sp. NIPERK01]|nr:hypothetical protein [Halalkalicoccus sp. NIPERK01]MDL5361292.1 hypothetical protein [Halalkalicoccus sp. NIPERK01]
MARSQGGQSTSEEAEKVVVFSGHTVVKGLDKNEESIEKSNEE